MKALKETRILFVHYEKITDPNPVLHFSGSIPACLLPLSVCSPAANRPGFKFAAAGVSAINMFTPGLLVMVSLFGKCFGIRHDRLPAFGRD